VVNGTPAAANELAYLPPGHETLELTASEDGPVRLILIGGQPLGEQIVMWWNFVGRSHEEIVDFRARWEAEIGAGADPAAVDPMFGLPLDDPSRPLPAPVLPTARLRPRR
jgi:hypothetical protein